MPYEVFLAFRYLRSRHKRRLVRVTALAAVLGIAMGVGALIVALALSNGFRDEMRDKILQGTAHLNVLRADGLTITDYASLTTRIRNVEGVTSAAATTYDGVLARGSKGSAYAVFRGVQKDTGQSTQLRQWLREGSIAELFGNAGQVPATIVGSEIAARLGLSLGDDFQIIPASSASGQARRLRVIGIFRSGLYEYDSTWLYVSLDTATSLSGANHAASVVSVQVLDVDNVKSVAERLRTALGDDYTIIDWQQANQPLFAALALERRMGLFIIGLIIAMAAINITTMLILVVVERRRDIAILNAMGATKGGVTLLFVLEGAVVGVVGALFGVVFGVLACVVGNYFKIVSLPADVYSISNVPLNPRPGEILLAASIAIVLSVLATIYPARAAARMRPVETLRDAG